MCQYLQEELRNQWPAYVMPQAAATMRDQSRCSSIHPSHLHKIVNAPKIFEPTLLNLDWMVSGVKLQIACACLFILQMISRFPQGSSFFSSPIKATSGSTDNFKLFLHMNLNSDSPKKSSGRLFTLDSRRLPVLPSSSFSCSTTVEE